MIDSNQILNPAQLWQLRRLIKKKFKKDTTEKKSKKNITEKMFTKKQSNGFSRIAIPFFTDKNFGLWIVNIRVKLRIKKFWKYTQKIYESKDLGTTGTNTTSTGTEKKITEIFPQLNTKKRKTMKKWEKKSQKAVDLIIFTINPDIQQKFTEIDFNNDYFMIANLRIHCQFTGSSKFMRLFKKYFILQYKDFKTIPKYFIHIKILKKRIDVTKIIFDTNNRTILCLMMLLF